MAVHRNLRLVNIAVGMGLLVSAIAPYSGQAVELADGTIAFNHPPSLVNSEATRSQAGATRVWYYFTLELPNNAGEPLQRMVINQEDSASLLRRVDYDLGETRAFMGTVRDRGSEVAIASATYDEDSQTVSVTLASPVEPGATVTLGLRPERNPRQEGVYLFGVTAYPTGEQSRGQFLGYGRFHLYQDGSPLYPF